jgi:hypothetical protein
MTSEKEAVYTDLVNAVESVRDEVFDVSRVVKIGQDNWYPDLLFRQDTMIVYETPADATIEVLAEDDADLKQSVGGEERYFKHIPDARPRLEDALNARGFVTEACDDPDTGQGRLRVFGWNRDPPWFREGDYVKVYRWRTPLEVVAVCPPGEEPTDDQSLPVTGDGTYIGAGSLHLYVRGNRGGEYLIDYDDNVASLYQRDTEASEALEKTAELSRTIFVGNPETGPRLDESPDVPEK